MSKLEDLAAIGIRPVKIDRYGPCFDKRDADKAILGGVIGGWYFQRRVRNLETSLIKDAIQDTEKMAKEFNLAIDKFLAVEGQLVDQSKKVAGSVRESSERLAQGIARVEKAANFDRLERYVILLERAAQAMSILADLEKSGKLEKIAGAIR